MATPTSFQGQVILITGAGSGIGRATSIKLAALGASLALSDINASSLEETIAQCTKDSLEQKHIYQQLDVGDSDKVNTHISTVIEQLGRIDHVFNCAGVNPTKVAIKSVTDDYFSKLVDTNIKGTFNITRASTPHLKSGASFVNVSSIAGIKPSAGTAVYSATKAAIIGFSKSLAMELGPRGIRVNVVAPGDIETPSNCAVVAGREALASAASKVALRRIGQPEEVADAVVFLFGPGSQYMNGSVVEINGGV
ncbi:3-oxoacyl-[acyl-carrier-protein] reductase FabG [Paramyrothecium foliicola]|nr:3-oxoacyl-[acyl-carrier-protein] reductase FabG [Paramyrothecium foliicola]